MEISIGGCQSPNHDHDHKNLEYVRSAKRSRPRQARWALFFSRFNFHLTYRPGSKNRKADTLSQMFPESTESAPLRTILSSQNFFLIQPILKSVIERASASCLESEQALLRKQDRLPWHQDKVLPQEARLQVFKTYHDHQLVGHFGARKTSELIQWSFWWPNLSQDCRAYVRSCSVCLRSKGDKTKPWGLLRPLPIPNCPWEMISMDFIVELLPLEGFTAILMVVDHLQNMAHFLPLVSTP